MTKREWRDVVGFEDRYEVSDDGLVRAKPRIMRAYPTKNGGHLQINLGAKRRTYVHRLVAEAFLPPNDGKIWVNHRNGDPTDNRVSNLEWVTPGENIAHGYRENGRKGYNNVAVIAKGEEGEIKHRFESMSAAAKHFNVTKNALRYAVLSGGRCCGLRWFRA